MNAHDDDSALVRKLALRAGALYLLMAFIAPIGIVYVPRRLFVVADAAATASAIRGSEWLLRVGMASELIHQAIEVFLIPAALPAVEARAGDLGESDVGLGLIPIPIVFLNTVNEIGAVVVLGSYTFLSPFSVPP